jgi:large subunit ribosomal protein L18
MPFNRSEKRAMRRQRVRRKVAGSAAMPRLSVYRSLHHIYAQVISDETGQTIAAVSTLSPGVRESLKSKRNASAAKSIGKAIAEKCLASGIKHVVFDRNGFLYHGRLKALADAAREAGLKL